MSAGEAPEADGEGTRIDGEGREVRRETIYGMLVDVVVCPPSRRRADSSIQGRRHRGGRRGGARGAWMARERGRG